MPWTKTQTKQHAKAAGILIKIIDEIAEYIKNNLGTTEVAVRQFIKQQYKKYHLVSDKEKSIVSFGDNTSNVHYYAAQPRRLKSGDLIMIDIWAKLAENSAPFADITWMMYYGRKLPREYANAFRLVKQARNKAVNYLLSNLKNKRAPIGKEVDAAARNYLVGRGQSDKFLHGTGHSLGLASAHGNRTRISKKGKQPLPLNVGYTIEPGIYFNNKFGIRSEINFYINENYKLIITTKVQNEIIKI